jgi:hypothetical protein
MRMEIVSTKRSLGSSTGRAAHELAEPFCATVKLGTRLP